MKAIPTGALAALFLCLGSGLALAQMGGPCLPRAEAVAKLAESYGEQAIGLGLGRGGMVYELFVAPEGNWTILMTRPGGASCIGASGEGWEISPLLLGEGS
jgi:hypothetical protein